MLNFSHLRYLILLLPVFLIVGCASLGQKIHEQGVYSPEVARLLSGQPLLGAVIESTELPDDKLFTISSEMAAFAEKTVAGETTAFERVKALHHALLKPQAEGGLGITYSAFTTETPIDTFEHRTANCLSFTILYVALARHLGLTAFVNEVQVPPTWEMHDKGVLYFMRHVNVRVMLHGNSNKGLLVRKPDDAVIDLEMNRYKATYPQETISDELTAVQFYSNRAMEFEAQGSMKKAFLYIRKALAENDQQSYVWNNLASLYRHEGLSHEAEVLYLQGLSLDHDDLTIMNNLASLYRQMGNISKSDYYSKQARRYRQSNPFYQYMLALSAVDIGDNNSALVYIKNAIRHEKKDARFYVLAASIYEQMGDSKRAAENNKLAQKFN